MERERHRGARQKVAKAPPPGGVPNAWNVSRFLAIFGRDPCLPGLRRMFCGVDERNIWGARRFRTMVATVMVVHGAFATLLAAAPRREKTLDKLRRGPIQKVLA